MRHQIETKPREKHRGEKEKEKDDTKDEIYGGLFHLSARLFHSLLSSSQKQKKQKSKKKQKKASKQKEGRYGGAGVGSALKTSRAWLFLLLPLEHLLITLSGVRATPGMDEEIIKPAWSTTKTVKVPLEVAVESARVC